LGLFVCLVPSCDVFEQKRYIAVLMALEGGALGPG
jgi:hypothetical protein